MDLEKDKKYKNTFKNRSIIIIISSITMPHTIFPSSYIFSLIIWSVRGRGENEKSGCIFNSFLFTRISLSILIKIVSKTMPLIVEPFKILRKNNLHLPISNVKFAIFHIHSSFSMFHVINPFSFISILFLIYEDAMTFF